jgi:hypothetical protein
VAATVDVTLLGPYYERFADHAVEIGGRVIYQATGSRYKQSDQFLQVGFVARTTRPATGAPASLRSSADSASAVSPDWVSTPFTYARLWL